MPNHVESTLDIAGPVSLIEKLIKQVGGVNEDGEVEKVFNCHAVIPMPKDVFRGGLTNVIEKQLKREGKKGWHEWCCDNWGSKWGVYSVRLYKNLPPVSVEAIKKLVGKKEPTTKIRYCWQSAWSPVDPVVSKLSEMYPDLKFTYTYLDEGMGFGCIVEYRNGEAIVQKENDFPAVRRKLRTPPSCLDGVEPIE